MAAAWFGVPVRIGCARCTFGDRTHASKCSVSTATHDRVVALMGESVERLFPSGCGKLGGEFVVTGLLSSDGSVVEVREIRKVQLG